MKRGIIILVCLLGITLIGFGIQSKPWSGTAPTTTITTTSTPLGNTYYVATTGSDRNVGSLAHPWLTIQYAANIAKAGDTVNIEAGTYISTALSFSTSGLAGSPIIFQNYNGGTVNVVINDTAFDAIQIGYEGESYIQLIGLNISAPTSQVGIDIWGSYITVQNCYVTDCESSGIGAEPSATYVTVDGCTVTGTNTNPDNEMISFVGATNFEIKNCLVYNPASAERVGIDFKQGCSYGSIHNNTVHDVGDGCIYVDAQGDDTSNINIYDNLCYNAANEAGLSIADEAGSAALTNISMYNNIVYNCRMGFDLNQTGSGTFNFSLINNTFYNNNNYLPGVSGAPGIEIHIDVPFQYLNNCIIRNNIIYSLTSGAYAIYYPDYADGGLTIDHNDYYNSGGLWDSGSTLGTNNITSNPSLVSPTTNFALQSNSPAIDVGSSIGAPSADYVGTARPQGAGYDIGAYE